MKFLTFFVLTALLFSCKPEAEFGVVTGNVFYKDNNFINRPDAGSSIRLINYEDTSLIYFTTADIRGDFKFDKVAKGTYLQVIQSENASSSFYQLAQQFDRNRGLVEKIFSTNTAPSFSIYLDKAKRYDSLEKIEMDNIGSDGGLKNYKYTASLQDSCEYFAEKAVQSISPNIRYHLRMNLSNMVDLKKVDAEKATAANSTIDFGTGYVRLSAFNHLNLNHQ